MRDLVGNWINLYTEDLSGLVFPVYLEIGQNQDPVAIAGDDQTGIVGEMLFFNGSDSYDPDGSIVKFEWDFGDEATTVGEIVTHAYSTTGTFTVTLTVTDDQGATRTDTTTVTVLTAAEATGQLIVDVLDLNLNQGIEDKLLSSLDNALKKLEDGNINNDVAAINNLGAFINKVEAQWDKQILEMDAYALIDMAQRIIASLS